MKHKSKCLCTTWGVDGENFEYNGCPVHSTTKVQDIRQLHRKKYDDNIKRQTAQEICEMIADTKLLLISRIKARFGI
jgi:hypothetical protein